MLEQDSVRVLAENGKSFYLAGLFLNSEELSKISKLYHFCRYVDDCADKLNPPQAAQALDYVKKTIMEKELSSPFQSFVQALEENGVQRSDMLELVRGAESDTSQVLIKNDDELDHYCFQVAGVVGLMM